MQYPNVAATPKAAKKSIAKLIAMAIRALEYADAHADDSAIGKARQEFRQARSAIRLAERALRKD